MKDFLPDDTALDPLFTEIDQKEREQAVKEGVEDARKSVSRLGSSKGARPGPDRTSHKGPRPTRIRNLSGSCSKRRAKLLGNEMETRSQVEAQLVPAAASLDIDPDRGFDILGSAIDRLEHGLERRGDDRQIDQGGMTSPAAANALDGEMRLNAGEFANITNNLDQRLLAFARKRLRPHDGAAQTLADQRSPVGDLPDVTESNSRRRESRGSSILFIWGSMTHVGAGWNACATRNFPQEVVMTLKPRKVFSAVHTVIILLSLVSSPLAQIPRQRTESNRSRRSHRRQREEKKPRRNSRRRRWACWTRWSPKRRL